MLGLTPWMDYEFRVLASNILGTGEPSGPSSKIRTKEAGQSCRCLSQRAATSGHRPKPCLESPRQATATRSSNPPHQASDSNTREEKGT